MNIKEAQKLVNQFIKEGEMTHLWVDIDKETYGMTYEISDGDTLDFFLRKENSPRDKSDDFWITCSDFTMKTRNDAGDLEFDKVTVGDVINNKDGDWF
jgi:hypothetical protein